MASVVAGPFWRQDRKILSPHGSRPNTKDRGWKLGSQTAIIAICFGLLVPFQTIIVCTEIKQKQPQDRKTVFETLSLPVAKILSPVVRQAPTKVTRSFPISDPVYILLTIKMFYETHFSHLFYKGLLKKKALGCLKHEKEAQKGD